MGLAAAAAIAGAGSLINAGSNIYGSISQNRQLKQRQEMASRYMSPFLNGGPGAAETGLDQLLARLSNGTTGGEAFNTGQDSLLQMLRTDPNAKARTAMEGMLETGDPFDTSNMFRMLEQVDARQRASGLADLRAGASGLGQRFGSSMMQGEQDVVKQLLESTGARNAQIQQGSYEAAQGRRMQAATSIQEMTQQHAQVAQTLANLGIAKDQADQTATQLLLSGYGQLGNMQSNRQTQMMQALSMLLGQPMQSMYNPGNDIGQIGQLMLFMNMMGNKGGANAGAPRG